MNTSLETFIFITYFY